MPGSARSSEPSVRLMSASARGAPSGMPSRNAESAGQQPQREARAREEPADGARPRRRPAGRGAGRAGARLGVLGDRQRDADQREQQARDQRGGGGVAHAEQGRWAARRASAVLRRAVTPARDRVAAFTAAVFTIPQPIATTRPDPRAAMSTMRSAGREPAERSTDREALVRRRKLLLGAALATALTTAVGVGVAVANQSGSHDHSLDVAAAAEASTAKAKYVDLPARRRHGRVGDHDRPQLLHTARPAGCRASTRHA